jgi:hypothetical protein
MVAQRPGRSLLRKIQEGDSQKNPLESIGLSAAILDLGLTDEQLLQHVQRIARDLMRFVHPDIHPEKKDDPAVKKFTDAVNKLGDPEQFKRALAEFKGHHAMSSAQERMLGSRIRQDAKKVAQLETELGQQRKRLREQASFRRHWRRYIEGLALQFGQNSLIKRIPDYSSLVVASFGVLFSNPPNESARPGLLDLYNRALAREGFSEEVLGSMRGIVNGNNLVAVRIASLVQRAKKLGFKAPAIRWDFDTAVQDQYLPYLASEKARQVAWEASSGTWSPEVLQGYDEFLSRIVGALGNRYVQRASIVPERVSLDGLILQDSIAPMPVCVLGTIPLDLAFALLERGVTKSTEAPLRVLVAEEAIERVEPFFAPGRAIVSLRVQPGQMRFRRNDSASAQLRWVVDKREETVRLYEREVQGEFFTEPHLCISHVILDI